MYYEIETSNGEGHVHYNCVIPIGICVVHIFFKSLLVWSRTPYYNCKTISNVRCGLFKM